MDSQESDATSLEEDVIKLQEDFLSLREEVAKLQRTNNSSQEILTNLLMKQEALDERVAALEGTQTEENQSEAKIQSILRVCH